MKYKNIYILLGFFATYFVNAQTLEDYLLIAKTNSSEIQEKKYDEAIAKEQINEVGNLNNTDISLGYFSSTPETRVGSQITKLGITQELPWFGTLEAEKAVAKSLFESKKFDIELTEKELLYKVKEAYYELFHKQRITAILKENREILSTYETMALSALENNRATMSDVLNIRVQKNELHSKIFRNLNEVAALSKNFNRLLQQDLNTQLVIIDSLNVLDILIPKNSVLKHPSIAKIEHLNAIYDSENTLIHKDKLPKLNFGLEYILVDERSDIKLSDNGKDIVMPKVSLSIPIFNKSYKSKLHKVQLQKHALTSKKDSQIKQLQIALEQGVLEIDNAILSVVAAQKNKEETQLAINVDLKAYETGILNYDKILKLQLQKIKFQLMEVEAIKNAFVAKSKTDYLTE